MRLEMNVQTHKIEEDYVTLFSSESSKDFQGILRSNKTAYEIMTILKENDLTREGILNRLSVKYEGDPDRMLEDIDLVLENLRTTGVLVEDSENTSTSEQEGSRVLSGAEGTEKTPYVRADQELIDLGAEALIFDIQE